MKKDHMIVFLTLVFSLIYLPGGAQADDKVARDIMIKVDQRNEGDNQTANMQMILIDKRGNKRIRKIRVMNKNFAEDDYRIMFFQQPADVKNTGFLTYDYDDQDRDDDQWLYLPALRKTKRISSNDKSGSFMGSDFTYSDMTKLNLDDYDFTLKKEMKVNNHDVWLIESVPRSRDVIDETGYTKSLSFVRKDNYVVIRSVSWVKKGKKVKYMDMKGLELIDDIWSPTEIHMTTKKGKKTLHKTVLKFTDIKYNQGLEEELFTTRRLEKGL